MLPLQEDLNPWLRARSLQLAAEGDGGGLSEAIQGGENSLL